MNWSITNTELFADSISWCQASGMADWNKSNNLQTKTIFKTLLDSIVEELPIILSHVRGYHADMTILEPKKGEFLKTRLEPENELDKHAVAVIKNSVVDIIEKGKTDRFAKKNYKCQWVFCVHKLFINNSCFFPNVLQDSIWSAWISVNDIAFVSFRYTPRKVGCGICNMGGPLSVILSDIFMTKIEKDVITPTGKPLITFSPDDEQSNQLSRYLRILTIITVSYTHLTLPTKA